MSGETLTDKQRELALDTLRSYLRESYRGGRGGALILPTFTMVKRTYPASEYERHGTDVTRRSEGGHSDPTAIAALNGLEGITVEVPGRHRLPAAAVTDIISTLPAHQFTPLWRLVVKGEAYFVVTAELQVSRTTLYERVDEGLTTFCRTVYGERWEMAAA